MFGKYASFIIPAYLLTAAALAATTLWIAAAYRARRKELKQLEDAGLKRRSDGGSA